MFKILLKKVLLMLMLSLFCSFITATPMKDEVDDPIQLPSVPSLRQDININHDTSSVQRLKFQICYRDFWVTTYCPDDRICCTPGSRVSMCCPESHPLCLGLFCCAKGHPIVCGAYCCKWNTQCCEGRKCCKYSETCCGDECCGSDEQCCQKHGERTCKKNCIDDQE